ncbi:Rossmann-fold NAD(P)-binding domain-containing protein [Algoriphagus mannitolivorans]|uniref:NAD(P)H-binding protein n=1 Tax=Algoriphagus mannitolivorans TaxID=226504 RepID=UPI00042933E8|nr:NAD(P)H-binding protein [Algoriphagus mannitolivorans]
MDKAPLSHSRPTVAIAGAGGYVGKWFINRYHEKYQLIGLSRKKVKSNPYPGVQWRQVELYSITSTIEALKGVDVAIYLIHSMNTTTRLNQGAFEDMDLLLADNFSRAAEIAGVKQIVYLGGLIPEDREKALSRHLKSRLEVEETLGSRKTKLTALRASIIVGPGGSSFEIIHKLVKRLPVMVCPKWTESLTQPIALENTLEIMDACIANPKAFGKVYEIGSPEVLSYQQMLLRTAKAMGKKRKIFSVPFFSLGLSKFWVGLFGDGPPQLVSPLVESLKHTLVVNTELKFDLAPIHYLNYEESLKLALHPQKAPLKTTFHQNKGVKNTVRSIQRMPNLGRNSALWVANRYKLWLPEFLKFIIHSRAGSENEIGFYLFGTSKPLLQLTMIPDRSDHKRQLFYITGGWLVKRYDYGWLEFREVLDGKYIISAIHEFVPRLPWIVYVYTQARIHLWVMNQFQKYLEEKIREV